MGAMEKPFLLHMFTPGKHVSPFDVNMAYDAGWTAAIPYASVQLDEIATLVQDTIFSRGPKGVKRTGVFIGGRDLNLAMDMLAAAKNAMFPPFQLSLFADPSGAFTSAAAMVATVERRLSTVHGATLADKQVLVLGGTGPVGAAAAVLAARAGARVLISGREIGKAERVAQACNERYGSGATPIEGRADKQKAEIIQETDVVFATAKAGVEVLSAGLVAAAPRLLAAADVNAVPPAGIAGLGVQDDGVPLPGSSSGAVGIGALVLGNVKYQTQHRLLQLMRESDEPLCLAFEQAFEVARACAG